MGVGARGEAGVGVAEVLGDLVECSALVEKQGGAGVAQVVAAEVGDASALECRNPNPAPPVLSTQVAAFGVREHEGVVAWATAGEVKAQQFARNRREELGLTA